MTATEDRPGKKLYHQYCPVTRALDVIGERWTLLIVRDLLLGTDRFNDLARGLPGLSRSLLAKRLRQLTDAGLVEQLDGRYLMTPAGQDLLPVVMGVGEWGARWVFGEPPQEEELDPTLLVWWIHGRLDASGLPDRQVVLQVRFTDDRKRFWILLGHGEATVCDADPGFPVDVTISADVSSLYQMWLGRLPVREALRSGRVSFEGPTALTRRMPDVLQLSPMHPAVSRHVTAG